MRPHEVRPATPPSGYTERATTGHDRLSILASSIKAARDNSSRTRGPAQPYVKNSGTIFVIAAVLILALLTIVVSRFVLVVYGRLIHGHRPPNASGWAGHLGNVCLTRKRASRLAGQVQFLFLELLADRLQFLVALRGRLRVGHLESFEGIEDDLGYDQPGVLLVVGGNDIPGRVARARRAQAFLVRLSCTASRTSAPRCPPG